MVSCSSDDEQTGDQYVLINMGATNNTKALMSYLSSNYKSKVLSGQYINMFDDFTKEKFLTNASDVNSHSIFLTDELIAIHSVTGKYPKIMGLDAALIPFGEDDITFDFAKEWYDEGGIVTMCWHWYAPNRTRGDRTFYSDNTDFNLAAALEDKNSADYAAIISDIDLVSEELKRLNDIDVPILWRPLHEASGGWFWWGANGSAAYKELYNIMYDRMTNHHHLNNLIWIANAQDKDWYVGDNKCDILGDDPYYYDTAFTTAEMAYKLNPTNSKRYNKCLDTTKNKIIFMTENEYIPDIDKMFEKGVYWGSFINWCREYVCVVQGDGTVTNEYSERYVSKENLIKSYSNNRVVVLDKE